MQVALVALLGMRALAGDSPKSAYPLDSPRGFEVAGQPSDRGPEAYFSNLRISR